LDVCSVTNPTVIAHAFSLIPLPVPGFLEFPKLGRRTDWQYTCSRTARKKTKKHLLAAFGVLDAGLCVGEKGRKDRQTVSLGLLQYKFNSQLTGTRRNTKAC